MHSVIFNPLKEYQSHYAQRHREETRRAFEEKEKRAAVDAAANKKTVADYRAACDASRKLTRKRNWLRFFRVLMIISVILLPLVFWKMTPKIRALKEEIASCEERAAAHLATAEAQMAPLNALFSEEDATLLIETVLPQLRFYDQLTAQREAMLRDLYDFAPETDLDVTTLDLLSGDYNENPLLFVNELCHTMGVETYHGSKIIHWTETYTDSEGRTRTRHRSQTLHAQVVKPKPFYNTRVVLHWAAQAAPELCFSRDASYLHEKSERSLKRHLKRGAKRLKRKTDRALRRGEDFSQMSNTEFEVLFDACDRTDEVQFRALFTPLAQTNLTELILSPVGYGDDFHLIKKERISTVLTSHSQGRPLRLPPEAYRSYDFAEAKQNFLSKNEAHFKAVYFDLAPLLSIPSYQEAPVQSLHKIVSPDASFSRRECEALINAAPLSLVAPTESRTPVILKSAFVNGRDGRDQIRTDAFSYDIEKRVDIVPVYGDDGRWHNVPVPWDEYIPLTRQNHFFVAKKAEAEGEIVATRYELALLQ